MILSVAKLQKADWVLVYEYAYNDRGAGFKTFASDKLPGITVTHDKKIGAARTIIYYTITDKINKSQRTDSPSQACKWWNQRERKNGSVG